MIGDLAATFVKFCNVLCNFSAIGNFQSRRGCSVFASSVGPGLYIKEGP